MYIDQEILNWALNSLGEYMVIVDTKGIIIMMMDIRNF